MGARRTAAKQALGEGSQVFLLPEEPVPEHDCPSKGQPWLRTVPADTSWIA